MQLCQILHFQYGKGFILFVCSNLVRVSRRANISLNDEYESSLPLIELRYPFDWRTPFGYLVASLAQFVGTLTVESIYIQFLNIVFGSCWLFIFVAEDIIQDVDAFNTSIKAISNESHTELTKRFCDLLRIYSDAKQ